MPTRASCLGTNSIEISSGREESTAMPGAPGAPPRPQVIDEVDGAKHDDGTRGSRSRTQRHLDLGR
jgi:hypothetical protein